ncbi:hypothetical protein BCIN_04g01010 [Botrytis cinerea B05.10]|uniref:Uncharacterized protein n=1 Tax=Botryotinia fuckeliana (strain B05.10) TaxID=332648 RepID=A0A384JE59_BOTFB|nr:hypothetical protein BCIN_04g01010 [Botrytis cinerea B05.10]ATZ48886.1 hypothetical protein BCIN_04g01010 [Botrytis cinerea B05.10]
MTSTVKKLFGTSAVLSRELRKTMIPKPLFFISLIHKDSSKQTEVENAQNEIATTASSWAPKIEQTVQSSKLYQRSAEDRCTIQGGWDRASYRAKLIEYLAKNTPWLTMRTLDQNYPAVEELTGDYHHDKSIYQNSVRNFLSSGFPEFQGGGLRIIEKYNGA